MTEPENPNNNNNNNANLNCADFDPVNNICNKCGIRFFKSDGMCKAVSNDCSTYDEDTGFCLTCYSGYVLRNGKCLLLSTIALTNCATPDPSNPSLCL